jgi:hypothetical protein
MSNWIYTEILCHIEYVWRVYVALYVRVYENFMSHWIYTKIVRRIKCHIEYIRKFYVALNICGTIM